jgi:hypothetical protein
MTMGKYDNDIISFIEEAQTVAMNDFVNGNIDHSGLKALHAVIDRLQTDYQLLSEYIYQTTLKTNNGERS